MSVTGILTRNWRLKIAALALAVLLWVTMRLSDQSMTRLAIPDVEVMVEQRDPDWLLKGQPSPSRVEMTVAGPLGDLFRVAMAEPVVVIPVDAVPEEDLVLELNADWVRNVDRGSVAIEDFAPGSIRLLFERNRVVDIPVSVRLIGQLPDSLALVSEPQANLLFAQVGGPASAVDPLETVFLEPFDLSGLTGSGRFDVALDAAGLEGLVVSPTTAEITVEVAPRISWQVGQLQVAFAGADEGWVVDPESLAVTLYGADVQLSAVDLDAIRLGVTADAAAVRVEVEQNGEAPCTGRGERAAELGGRGRGSRFGHDPQSRPAVIAPILGIETTCDETSASVLDEEGKILSLVIHSQDVHRIYGGVVPELAARDHLKRIEPVVAASLEEADIARTRLRAVAVAAAPGLIGALLVGVSWSRAAAFALGIPWVPVHHMEGHLFGPVLEDPAAVPPFVALLVSGGHTMLLWVPEWGRYRLLGQTRDDAVGEAFDKVAKLLGMPYPGGPAIEAAARRGDPRRFDFPRPMLKRRTEPGEPGAFDFSFSGLKTAVAQTVARLGGEDAIADERDHLAASFQEAALDVLAGKTLAAVEAVGCERVLLGGGVSANGALRGRLRAAVGPGGSLFTGSPRVSLDNGAMIARAAQFRLAAGSFGGLDQAAASAPIPGMLPWTPEMRHRSRGAGRPAGRRTSSRRRTSDTATAAGDAATSPARQRQ